MANPKKALDAQLRGLAWLGLLLQVFSVMFGIPGLVGALICASNLKKAKGTIYESHLRWQIVSFFMGAAAVIASYLAYDQYGVIWPMFIAGILILYRLLTSFFKLIETKPINRWL